MHISVVMELHKTYNVKQIQIQNFASCSLLLVISFLSTQKYTKPSLVFRIKIQIQNFTSCSLLFIFACNQLF